VKKGILWMLLSLLLVAALMLGSCAEAVPGEQEEDEYLTQRTVPGYLSFQETR